MSTETIYIAKTAGPATILTYTINMEFDSVGPSTLECSFQVVGNLVTAS